MPRIAQVGISRKEAEQNPSEYRIEELAFGKRMAWLIKAEKDAHITCIFDKNNLMVDAAVYSDDSGSYIDGYQVKLVSDTSYGSLWEVSFNLKEF